jgi:DNA-binding response OmpR family regulator
MLRNILFVDDDLILRCAVEKHLATYAEHFSTVVASDGFDAVKKLKMMPFSLVIADLIMPRMDGMSLVSHMRDHYPDIPIVIISGMPAEQMQHLAETNGIVGYLSKPFQADELVATIMSTLRREAAGGIMHDVSPAVFLQLMEMDAKTCTIRILDKASKQGGILYFRDGQLLDARIGEEYGHDAALKVFTWDAVTIFLRNDCPPLEDRIHSGLQSIIMKAAGMKDESDDAVFPGEDPTPAAGNPAGTLAGLVLPDDFPTSAVFGEGAAAGSSDERGKTEGKTTLPLDALMDLLGEKAGIPYGPDNIQHNQTLDQIVLQLDELGAGSQFGNFQAGYIVTGKAFDQILLPGQPTAVVTVPPDSPRDRILDLLRTAAGNRLKDEKSA